MRFKGKIDLWFWLVMLAGDAMIILPFFDTEMSTFIVSILVITAIIYNIIFLPLVIKNYVEVTDGKLTVAIGFWKGSMDVSEIVEIYRTHNPIASSAASLDRIVIKGRNQELMCAVVERERFFAYMKEQNPAIQISQTGGVRNSKAGKISMIITGVICILVGILLTTGNITVEYKEESFVIKATYWYDKEIDYADIESMEYRDEEVEGSRTGGFESFRLMLGDYQNNELGNYSRYTYMNCDAGIILLVNGREVVLSGKDKESTLAIYEELQLRYGM